MKQTYKFSGHRDYARRFGDAIHVGDTGTGKAVWAWRDGLWTVSEHCGNLAYDCAMADLQKAERALRLEIRTEGQ